MLRLGLTTLHPELRDNATSELESTKTPSSLGNEIESRQNSSREMPPFPEMGQQDASPKRITRRAAIWKEESQRDESKMPPPNDINAAGLAALGRRPSGDFLEAESLIDDQEIFTIRKYKEAVAYETGDKVPKNPAQAVEIYEALIADAKRPNDRSFPVAHKSRPSYFLNLLFLNEPGDVEHQGRNDTDRAMFRLACLYKQGAEGVEPNPKKAFELLKELEGFHIEAQFVLGQLYEQGLGVEQDLAQAILCYSAIRRYHEEAAKRLAVLERNN